MGMGPGPGLYQFMQSQPFDGQAIGGYLADEAEERKRRLAQSLALVAQQQKSGVYRPMSQEVFDAYSSATPDQLQAAGVHRPGTPVAAGPNRWEAAEQAYRFPHAASESPFWGGMDQLRIHNMERQRNLAEQKLLMPLLIAKENTRAELAKYGAVDDRQQQVFDQQDKRDARRERREQANMIFKTRLEATNGNVAEALQAKEEFEVAQEALDLRAQGKNKEADKLISRIANKKAASTKKEKPLLEATGLPGPSKAAGLSAPYTEFAPTIPWYYQTPLAPWGRLFDSSLIPASQAVPKVSETPSGFEGSENLTRKALIEWMRKQNRFSGLPELP